MGIGCKKYVGKTAGLYAKTDVAYVRGKSIARKDATRSSRVKDNDTDRSNSMSK